MQPNLKTSLDFWSNRWPILIVADCMSYATQRTDSQKSYLQRDKISGTKRQIGGKAAYLSFTGTNKFYN